MIGPIQTFTVTFTAEFKAKSGTWTVDISFKRWMHCVFVVQRKEGMERKCVELKNAVVCG